MAVVVGVLGVSAAAWAIGPPRIDRAASGGEVALRGAPAVVERANAMPAVCPRVAVIGDSLSDNSHPWIRSGLRDAGYTYALDAQPSRRTPSAVRAPYSGVRAALAMRDSFGESACWVIALGSNDLAYVSSEADISDLIDEMLAAITPDAAVWWTNVDYRRDPRTAYNFGGWSLRFNAVLDERAASDPAFTVIDWYGLVEANRQWFFDPVHVNREGSIRRAEQLVAALPAPK